MAYKPKIGEDARTANGLLVQHLVIQPRPCQTDRLIGGVDGLTGHAWDME